MNYLSPGVVLQTTIDPKTSSISSQKKPINLDSSSTENADAPEWKNFDLERRKCRLVHNNHAMHQHPNSLPTLSLFSLQRNLEILYCVIVHLLDYDISVDGCLKRNILTTTSGWVDLRDCSVTKSPRQLRVVVGKERRKKRKEKKKDKNRKEKKEKKDGKGDREKDVW
ncbi:hypothetical protein BDZ97DRAFT_2038702 [Flammula alnicola]|nr:hypothetical protein BDZ97DRAFT_2038702 [Flammula alnicola]